MLTFPWATSSFWATVAALIKTLAAFVMDFAASKICSSKFKFSFKALKTNLIKYPCLINKTKAKEKNNVVKI